MKVKNQLLESIKTEELFIKGETNINKGYTVVWRCNDNKMYLIRNCMMNKFFKEYEVV